MRKFEKVILSMILCVFVASLCACGKANKSDEYASLYGETIAGLQDDELFAVIETDASDPVLLVTSQYYDDGQGNQASIWCDVYYPVDGTVKNIGKLESMGTAYPISYDKNGIYITFGNTECYEIDEKEGTVTLVEGIDEQSEDAVVVNFSYGASDAQ
jgi:hypothetical protein